MNDEFLTVVHTIIASLTADDRAKLDRRRLKEFIRGKAEAGETNRTMMIVQGMDFARSSLLKGDEQ